MVRRLTVEPIAPRTAPRAVTRTAPRTATRTAPRTAPRITPRPAPPASRRRDRGQVAIEYLGFLPILLLVGLVGVQFGIAAYVAQQAGTGARAAARAASVDDPRSVPDPEVAGKAAMSGWAASRSRVKVAGGVATVVVKVPSLIPFVHFGDVRRSAVMPLPDETRKDRP
ncbi:TadE/TadG family type IV pilus assembly protein [Streptomyces sp. NPDC094032]|uniref:TadE/TadG family type IV pilus assembly protein n=1 Tax=Streptomyces sp. NPDC094032 TaxID=3155308 RepID=UPI00331E7BA2